MNIIYTIALRAFVIVLAGIITMMWPAKAEEASISPSAEEPPELMEVETLPPPPVAETPVTLKKIAWCESRNRQFNTDGTLLRGVVNSQDVGKFQINEHYHLADSQRLGMDITTLAGNTAYAEHIYKTQGAKPWSWSEHCWGDVNRVWIEKGGEYWSE